MFFLAHHNYDNEQGVKLLHPRLLGKPMKYCLKGRLVLNIYLEYVQNRNLTVGASQDCIIAKLQETVTKDKQKI